ncbi:LuxR C-terminal-related transcriptional regulator [Krasilnikovia sp. M28-CT-15]|uniref:LuxR C-terminal-related transcriptional regulator n=1 Tax=Krasilnikovia sp. M28-CT-15 TaxID=3373540 RepID=UPI003876601D
MTETPHPPPAPTGVVRVASGAERDSPPRPRESDLVVQPLTFLHGPEEITKAVRQAVCQARIEILSAQPDGFRPPHVLKEAFRTVEDRLRAGVAMRTLYQHSARFDEPTKEYVRAVSCYNAEVRTLDEFFDRMILVDRQVALVPANPDRSAALRVTEPALVAFLADVFERSWSRAEAHPFVPASAAHSAPDVIPELRAAIKRLLVQGYPDTVVARRLGLSQRTVQAHIARMKDEFGAVSRLQLGYFIARSEKIEMEQGLMTSGPPA